LIIFIKKKLLTFFNSIGYTIGKLFYGTIKESIDSNKCSLVNIFKSNFGGVFSYNIYKIKKCRIYTDTVTDTAFIADKKIIVGPSFQLRKLNVNADISENIILSKGTPRIKKKLKGSVFSLLTGGAGNSNYWHWLFDVLPRIKILESKIGLDEINYFLLPDLKEKFQNETLDLINVPVKKRISSKKFRHIEAETVIAVDHPINFNNNPNKDIQNMPKWILEDLRFKFLKNENTKKYPDKIYIDRSDAKSNHKNLRKILNETEIINLLEKKGFSIIKLSDFKFIEQVNLFNNASQIIGLHGGGFANLTFCKPETFVLELKSITAGDVIGNLARKLDLNFHEIAREPEDESKDQQGLIKVPIELLEKKLLQV